MNLQNSLDWLLHKMSSHDEIAMHSRELAELWIVKARDAVGTGRMPLPDLEQTIVRAAMFVRSAIDSLSRAAQITAATKKLSLWATSRNLSGKLSLQLSTKWANVPLDAILQLVAVLINRIRYGDYVAAEVGAQFAAGDWRRRLDAAIVTALDEVLDDAAATLNNCESTNHFGLANSIAMTLPASESDLWGAARDILNIVAKPSIANSAPHWIVDRWVGCLDLISSVER